MNLCRMKNFRKVTFSFLLALFASVFVCTSAYAQSRSISGTVTDNLGDAVIGASISVKGTKLGAVTDIDGNFALSVPQDGNVLVVSYIGMRTQEVPITGSVVNVVLEEDVAMLEEVVVIGYGTVKRKDLTGSVSSVSADALVSAPVSSVVEAMTGKMAGVQITTTEGSPDAEMKIRVRGGGSITGDNTPLFIVDGFPVESISDIPASDIESIDVLKDGSSTAIYGSRGANGVVIVTTKSGKEGKINVNYNAFVTWKKMAKKLDIISPYDYVNWQYERAMLDDGEPDDYVKFFGNYQDMDLYQNIDANDWQEQVFGRTGFTFNHNLSINGGTDKTKYLVSYNHINDKAIMQMSDFRRNNLNLKLNNKPHERILLDFSVRYSDTEINGGGANEVKEISSADSRLKNAMIYPSFPVNGLTDSDETDDGFNLHHPLVSIADNNQKQERKTLSMNASAQWEIIDNLKLRTEVGLEDYNNSNARYYGTSTYYVKNNATGENQGYPAIIFTKTERNSLRNTNTLNYDFNKFLPSPHNLNVLLGQEYLKKQQEALTSTVHGFPKSFDFDQAYRLSAQGNARAVENYLSADDILLSFFGRANYDYDSKYIASATFRYDGSSRFSEGNQWGFFPSAALAWRISSESFMESTKHWLSDLKLRFSYGTAGNNNIPLNSTIQPYEVKETPWVNGFNSYWAPSKGMANPDLKWETTVTRNLGLDFVLFNGRISSTIEAYLNSTKDLHIQFPTPGTGYDYQYRNMGETENRGIEATINVVAIDKKDFGLSFSANIGFNKNKVVSLDLIDEIIGDAVSSGWASTEVAQDYIIRVGSPVGQMYGYVNEGRYEVSDFSRYDAEKDAWILKEGVADAGSTVGTVRPGTIKLKDQNDDGIINTEDKTIIGDYNPLHTGGFSINARFYGFDLLANFNWSYGNDVYNANKIEYTSTSKYHSRNMISEMESGKRWTNLLPDGTICNDPEQLAQMNANTTMWSPFMKQFIFSDWAVEDGSFLRLNTLTLGYTLPKLVTNKLRIQNLRFYASGYNVFCWTNYSGFDPEVSTRRKTALTPGVDYSAYPKSRSLVFGMNLTF